MSSEQKSSLMLYVIALGIVASLFAAAGWSAHRDDWFDTAFAAFLGGLFCLPILGRAMRTAGEDSGAEDRMIDVLQKRGKSGFRIARSAEKPVKNYRRRQASGT